MSPNPCGISLSFTRDNRVHTTAIVVRSRILALVALVAALACPSAAWSADKVAAASAPANVRADAQPAKSYKIPAGDAAITLKQFSEQSGLSIMFVPDSVKGVMTGPVIGEMSAQAALDKLLGDTRLYAVPTKEPGAYAIKRKGSNEPNGQRAAQAAGSRRSAQSKSNPNPPVVGAVKAGDEQAVILPPFEVRTEQDRGYMAQNTVSGSRLNASLKDTPAAISVFTEAFLDDIAVTDIDGLSEYVLNVDRDVGIVSAFGGNPVGNNVLEFDAAFKVRGLPLPGGTGRSVNFFGYPIEIDTYNTERIEFARGPNSILFGVAATGGNFNINTKKANVRKAHYRVGLRTSSYDEVRGTLDINQPVIDGKLGLRINLLGETKNGWRAHEFKDAERMHIAAHYEITPRTTLDVEYEKGHIEEFKARPWVSQDFITAWLAAGSPIDPAPGAPYPAGTVNYGPGLRRVYDTGSDQLYIWRNLARSAPALSSRNPLITDFNLVPREAVTAGPGAGRAVDYKTLSAFLRHEVIDDLFVELAASRHEHTFLVRDVSGHNIQIDTSGTLPGGQPNPNAGRAFIDSIILLHDRRPEIEDIRATASYAFDLGRIFGKHQLVGLAQRNELEQRRLAAFETVITNPPDPRNPQNGINRLRRRTYVDLDGPAGEIAQADYRLNPINGQINVSTGLPEQTAFVAANEQNTKKELFTTTTYMAATQSRFWDNRIVATVGYREDIQEVIESTAIRGAPFGDFTVGDLIPEGPLTTRKVKGATRSQGVVFHATKWLAAFYNRSSNFALPNPAITQFPNSPVPSPEGEGEDMGIKLSLLDGKLFATVTYYETAARSDSAFGVGNSVADTNFIWQSLDAAGVLAASGKTLAAELISANGFTFDSASQGWEFELVANPVSNWRLSLNFSDNKTARTNVGLAQLAYVEANRAVWLEGQRGRIQEDGTLADNAIDPNDGSNINTVAERLARIDTFTTSTFLAPDGALHAGSSRYAANLRTNYSFSDGRLEGFSVGGGARWRGSPILGYTSSDPATRELIMGKGYYVVDANITYRGKMAWMGRKGDWSVQLNVNNVLDEDDLIFTNANPDGTLRSYRLPTPRMWILSSTLRF